MLRHGLAAAVVLFSAAVRLPSAGAQAPPTAGATRPNLRVLHALPESQLFPLMNLVAESLGVRCDYCHVQISPDYTRTPSNVGGWAWDRDDKAPKRIARDMMRMVIDLNGGRFHGASRITCYTCHRGSTRPPRTPPLPPAGGSANTAAPVPLPQADRVWASYVDAVGHDEETAGTATIISGWDDRPEGRYGKLEIIISGVDRYRATVSTAGGTSTQALNRAGGWIAANDRVQQLSESDVARLRRTALRYRPLRERPPNLQVIGVDRVDDRDVYVASARIDSITTSTFFFDVVTGLLRREVTTTETLLLPLQEQVDYDDYRDVDGVRFPFRVRTSDGAPYATVTRTFLRIARNVPIDDAQFHPPSGRR